MDDEGGWLSVGDTARIAGLSRQAVHAWLGRGVRHRVGDDGAGIRIEAAVLARLLAVRRVADAFGVRPGTVRRWAATDAETATDAEAGGP